MSIEKHVLERISPDPEYRERLEELVQSLLEKVRSEASAMGLDVEVMLVGSVAKNTYTISPDIDVFTLFSPEVPRDRLESEGLELGRRVIDGQEKYAEHPYIHGEFKGLRVDIVPSYKIEDTSSLKSAVDRTPFHLEYVLKNLKPEQRDQVRLLKQFMKGVGVYGAEAKVEGFPGYLTELLIMKYGTFRSVIENASSWTHGTTLWLEGKGRSKFQDPLIFYDPVDLKRNVASALTVDRFALFIQACKEFSYEERLEFFFPREREPLPMSMMIEMIAERGTSVVIVSFDRPGILDDNLYPQIRRTHEGLLNLLMGEDFVVVDSAFHPGERISFVFELQEDVLPRCRKHVGPPVWIEHSQRFLEKWGKAGMSRPFIEKGRWNVLVEREFTNAVDLLIEKVESTALGSEFKRMIGYGVIGGDEAFESGNEPVLSSLLDKRMNWEV